MRTGTACCEVNLRAHIRAADALLPELDRPRRWPFRQRSPRRRGLLTQVGCGRLRGEQARRGRVRRVALDHLRRQRDRCDVRLPHGGGHPLLDAITDSEDATARVAAASITTAGDVLSAEDVAAATLAGIRDDRFLVLPHASVLDMYRGKGADYDRWISGMRRYQRALGG